MSSRVRLGLGVLCVAAGVGLLARAAAIRADAAAWQARHAARLAPAAARLAAREEPARPPVPGEPVARLRIPGVGLDVVVAEGVDPATLARAPGHMPGSALPGQPDNCIIAGHRDGPFGRLHSVREGDWVILEGPAARGRYRVVSVGIVGRDDPEPLARSGRPLLTLITCHPLGYLGPAPQRLVVRGELAAVEDGGA
ncbi:MAG: class D sortase [Acidobacteriota bacterium]